MDRRWTDEVETRSRRGRDEVEVKTQTGLRMYAAAQLAPAVSRPNYAAAPKATSTRPPPKLPSSKREAGNRSASGCGHSPAPGTNSILLPFKAMRPGLVGTLNVGGARTR